MRDNRETPAVNPFLMTPEKERALKEHIQAIATILYEETSPEQLRDLESIEATVHHQVTQYVSPPIGIFYPTSNRDECRKSQETEELDWRIASDRSTSQMFRRQTPHTN
jgi:hypothetical protein